MLRTGITEISRLALIDGDPHHPSLLLSVAQRLVQNVCPMRSSIRRRFFISRQGAGYIKLLNENELLAKLQKYEFECVTLEKLGLFEQIKLFANAECIIGMHGSGLANMIFSLPDAKVIEVVARDFPCPDFYRLANSLGLSYYLLFGESIGDANPGYKNMVAPVESINSLVAELFTP